MSDDPLTLVHAYLDGELSEGQRRQFGDWLHADARNIELLVAESRLHSELFDLHAANRGRVLQTSGRRVESGELRVESEGEWLDSPDFRIPHPEIPVINLQIAKSQNLPNLRFPHPSPLSSLSSAWAFSYSVATVLLAVFLLGAWSYTIIHPAADSLAVKNSRGTTPSSGTANTNPEFTFVGRVSGMVDCQWADEATATSPGASVALNRRYALKSGLMEISYDSGAKVILQGPCEYTIESARGGFLKVGKLVAHMGAGGKGRGTGNKKEEQVEGREEGAKPQAENPESPNSRTPNPKSPTPHAPRPTPLFTVRTPTALVEDLGTEFGVEVAESGETASHVFQGQVRVTVEGAGDEGRETGTEKAESPNPRNPNREIILSAGQSARVERDGNKLPRIVREENKTAPVAFVQRLPRPMPIKLFNTGIGLKEGEPDPHWQVVARSDDPAFQPRPALVTPVVWPKHLANIPHRSQWISLAGLSRIPNGVTYVFRTTFELPAAATKSAMISGRFIADNCVTGIRLNGRPIDVPKQDQSRNNISPFFEFHAFTIKQGFVAGVNVLEIDVWNGMEYSFAGDGTKSPMSLRVELEGRFLGDGAAEQKNTLEGRIANE
jgi:hypothetical protein